ncbi:VOC family protein [Pseudoclavibacter chungangensis]|uniref:VOC family protein n=1 Tax=Pseudoclavibacter chungangensis TaxID=587635 RepID=A0A7J5BP52_9MICO|nr:VOC family protein [Pseudoclavibacter chungangensis]KAB1654331.1 VOC family protein [Pseudoclavibacter chungangensis]NYJ65252.1 catechol 2,3-dioxygenase-like lactoylglutathione lyase family enzyme [Pseudoclavibacter chungangensis]
MTGSTASIGATKYVFALDCPDASALAAFYARLLGWRASDTSPDAEWVDVRPPEGESAAFWIACQRVEDHRAPEWPDGPIPQQAHLDFYVASIADSTPHALAAGARKHEYQPSPDGHFVVFLDPAGHPFCLCEE